MSEKDSPPLGYSCESDDDKDPLFFANVSDSDFTSPESDDSLELSESESITDVTPLNSPYCDSPLPPTRLSDISKDSLDDPDTCETNVLIQAIKKLEVENPSSSKKKSSYRKKRADLCTSENCRRLDPENCLLKHVMSQQSRIKPSTSHDRLLHRKSTVINRHRQMTVDAETKVSPSSRLSKELSQSRQMKCLSHPSTSRYSYAVLENAVRCGKELKTAECSQNAVLKVTSEAMSGIDSNVTAH